MIEYIISHTAYSAQHFINAVFNGLAPVLAISGTIWIALKALRPLRKYAEVGGIFAIVGATIGILTGASREAAVQATLPAMIALVTGYLGWLLRQEIGGGKTGLSSLSSVPKESDPDSLQPTVMLVVSAVVGLMLAAPTGTMWGASMRDASVTNDRRYQEWRYSFENQQVPLQTELLRRDLGLTSTQDPESDPVSSLAAGSSSALSAE